MNLSPIDRVFVDIPVTATERDGSAATVEAVFVAVLAPRVTPTADTAWTSAPFADDVATVLLAGPDADDTDALAIPKGDADLWVRVADTPEIQAVKAGRVTIS